MDEIEHAARFGGAYLPDPEPRPLTVRGLLGRRFWIGVATLIGFVMLMLGTGCLVGVACLCVER